ncbi:hypothetical protein J4E81_000237 [Alternaria sp. BMP 2799]|nr:hypothetical protein J4E81_000237 [Alternaria sp. BMP 2799]
MTVNRYAHAAKLQDRMSLSSLDTVQLQRPASRFPLLRNPTLATMPPKATPPEFPVQAFPTCTDFETFLEREHATAPGLYVKLAKKNSGTPSITAAEAVEVALCYGWIDGRANACDETWWTVRYTPRRANSMWSQKNVGTVARLIETGRMRPAGLAAVDAAKADGRWDRAYAGSATIVVPEDLKIALAQVPAAEAQWESMNKGDRYTALLKVETAIDEYAPTACRRKRDGLFGKNIQQRGVVWNEAIRASHRWASTFPMPPASSITYPIDFTDREKSLLNSYAAVFLNKNKHFSSADATRAELDTACDLILKDWPMKKGKTPRIARVVFTEAKNNLLRAEKANLQENEESAMGTASKRARRKRPLVESEDED